MERKIKNGQLQALINLLDEPDEGAYSEIRQQMVSFGPDVVPYLEEQWGKSDSDLRQKRLLNIIHKLQLEELYRELTIWTNFESKDIWEGYYILNRFLYKELKKENVEHELDRIRRDILFELHDQLTPLQKVRVINHIMYEIHHFKGNTSPGDFINSYFIHHLFNKRRGSAVSLGILYMTLAQSLGIPIYGVLLPRHFILAYMDADFSGEVARQGDVRFYVNPVYRGTVFTRREISRYLKQSKQDVDQSFLYPSTNQEVLGRLIEEIQLGYENRDKIEHVEELEYLKNALNLPKDGED